eukprot:g6777.t1
MNPSQRSVNPQKETRRRELGPSIEQTDLNRPTRFISDMRFRVDIPRVIHFLFPDNLLQVECPLKSLVTPFDAKELSKFKVTNEEKLPGVDLLLPRFLGCQFNSETAEMYSYDPPPASPEQAELSDPETLDSLPSMNNEDFEILDAVDSLLPEKLEINSDTLLVETKTKKPIGLLEKDARWWIKSSTKGVTQSQFDTFSRKTQMKMKKRKFRTFTSQKAFNDFIKKGFEKLPPESRTVKSKNPAWMANKSPQLIKTKKAVAIYNLLPYEDELGRSFCTVNFHNNCIEDSERLIPHERYSTQISGTVKNILLKELYVEPRDRQEAEVNRAIGFDNKYLGLIAPCKVNASMDRRESFIKTEADYLWIREYFYRKKEEENDLGKWKWAIRLDREKKVAQLIPIQKRFVTQKQKLRSVVHRPISVHSPYVIIITN